MNSEQWTVNSEQTQNMNKFYKHKRANTHNERNK